MVLLGHAVLLFVASFVGYLLNADRGNRIGRGLLLAVPALGVFLLGWLALATCLIALILGGMLYWRGPSRAEEQARAVEKAPAGEQSEKRRRSCYTPVLEQVDAEMAAGLEAARRALDARRGRERLPAEQRGKSYSQLVAAGFGGGLVALASAERTGTLFAGLPRGRDLASDPLAEWMKRNGVPITREGYLLLAFPEGIPKWVTDVELELPRELQQSVSKET